MPNHSSTLPQHRIGAAILVTGLILFLDGSVLLANGTRHLGVWLPFWGGLALCLGYWQRQRLATWRAARRWHRRLWNWGAAGLIAWLISVLLFFIFIQGAHDRTEHSAPRALIVLGSGSPECRPSATLAARLELARQQAIRWPQAWIIVSGGRDDGLACSEAEVMADSLRAAGVATARIILETASRNTAENLAYSSRLLGARGIVASDTIMLVSSDFHLPRAYWIAQQAGWHSVATAGAPTPPSVRLNAWLREYFSFVKACYYHGK
ncbi:MULTISPECIES: YdcF family protein [unclassified Undibacterium]|uniref:YdcF family protein n=1 Tax=unclassified Undibacterium TaxID=2630295 RepID=UPI002AC97BDB|nr:MULTISPECIES: YdcF family protein [unclassified Undibacterium]MEB0139404.1 YdcF family protein [Undibacterium sp. CCC2.1]MEB0173795.1 YdcF family protein [Undibacterium sp. CCC1.1]MEB0177434.1 YdcF family protein [Undibacterium sp. CCC3.4]MEB0216605.1 YdcF family protein [Undibacterium sp. 5I2]WPX44025.1 YdcF family protein [Undibacterium sp. CCC3.4]